MSKSSFFSQLGLPSSLLSTLEELGYESPTPVQQQSIPFLLSGKDVIAQAQTGTGKTASFALPILSHLDLKLTAPQAIIITPTRELAIQVAEAFQSYAKNLKDFHVLPIYGGQEYRVQLRALKRGPHVIVGTPGRVMDHFRRGSLTAASLKTVVLDEADEMLKMGFVEDIEWILSQIEHEHQTALFSATMPAPIKKIAHRYLKDPVKVQIQAKTNSVETIDQQYICVGREHKLEALSRFLEMDNVQAAIIFARTKTASVELADKLQARGFAAAALNGDMKQSHREKVLARMKKGHIDIIVATDVAARGIDVERISHVINYDIPHDTESYIHRIGRTGRAGRSGTALLLVTPREIRLLKDIERATKKQMREVQPPTVQEMSIKRNHDLMLRVEGVITKSKKLKTYVSWVEELEQKAIGSAAEIAAALAYLMQQQNALSAEEIEFAKPEPRKRDRKPSRGRSRSTSKSGSGSRSPSKSKSNTKSRSRSSFKSKSKSKSTSSSKGRSSRRPRR